MSEMLLSKHVVGVGIGSGMESEPSLCEDDFDNTWSLLPAIGAIFVLTKPYCLASLLKGKKPSMSVELGSMVRIDSCQEPNVQIR